MTGNVLKSNVLRIVIIVVTLTSLLVFGVLVYGQIVDPRNGLIAKLGTTGDLPAPGKFLTGPVVSMTEEGRLQEIHTPKYVKAGFYPSFIGDALGPIYGADPSINNPGLVHLTGEERTVALELPSKSGLAGLVDAFIPGTVEFLGGKCVLAFLLEDLEAHGVKIANVDQITENEHIAISQALLKMFRIDIDTPGFASEYPRFTNLHLKFVDHRRDVTVDGVIEMESRDQRGSYYIKDLRRAQETLVAIERKATDVSGRLPLYGLPSVGDVATSSELQVVGLSGINDSTLLVDDMPPVRGVVLTHKIFLGSHQVEYGWQWFGRSSGLHKSQVGFLTP